MKCIVCIVYYVLYRHTFVRVRYTITTDGCNIKCDSNGSNWKSCTLLSNEIGLNHFKFHGWRWEPRMRVGSAATIRKMDEIVWALQRLQFLSQSMIEYIYGCCMLLVYNSYIISMFSAYQIQYKYIFLLVWSMWLFFYIRNSIYELWTIFGIWTQSLNWTREHFTDIEPMKI